MECPSCNRSHERTVKGWRPIRLNAAGICAACQDHRDEAADLKVAERKGQ